MKPKIRLPWWPLTVDDFELDEAVRLMTLEQVGAYIRLLNHQWREGSIPAAPAALAALLAVPAEQLEERIWPALEGRFPANSRGDRRRNQKLERVRETQRARHEAAVSRGAKGGRARHLQTRSIERVDLRSSQAAELLKHQDVDVDVDGDAARLQRAQNHPPNGAAPTGASAAGADYAIPVPGALRGADAESAGQAALLAFRSAASAARGQRAQA